MSTSTWTAAMLVLAVVVVGGAAGTAAVSASYEDSKATYNATHSQTEPPVLAMGKDVSSTMLTVLPWLGLVAVPLGIVGLLGLGLTRRSSNGGRRR